MYLYPVTSRIVFEEWQAWLNARRDRAQRNRAHKRIAECLVNIATKLKQVHLIHYAILGRNRTDIFAQCTLEIWIDEASTLRKATRKICLQLCDQGMHREVEQVFMELRRLEESIEKSKQLIKSMRR